MNLLPPGNARSKIVLFRERIKGNVQNRCPTANLDVLSKATEGFAKRSTKHVQERHAK